jgi:hypothetical protein
MTSFDRAQQAHDANTEPDDVMYCADAEHTPNWKEMRLGDLPGIVYADCENCDATAWAAVETEHFQEWEL